MWLVFECFKTLWLRSDNRKLFKDIEESSGATETWYAQNNLAKDRLFLHNNFEV